MMNGAMHNHDPSIGFYNGNGSIPTSYPSTFTSNTRQTNSVNPQVGLPNIPRPSLPTNSNQQTVAQSKIFRPPLPATSNQQKAAQSNIFRPQLPTNSNQQIAAQSNIFRPPLPAKLNQQTATQLNTSRPTLPTNPNQQAAIQSNIPRISLSTNSNQQAATTNSATNGNVYNFQNGATNSTDYYNRIHGQTRSNTPGAYRAESNNLTQSSTSTTLNVPTEKTFLVVPGTNINRKSPLIQPPPSAFTPIPSFDHRTTPNETNSDIGPSPEYLHYTIDSLIQCLVPTDTYIPKQAFIYAMILCSRTNIRPSLLFNQLARLTIKSVTNMNHDRSIRTMNNFLYVLSQWARTFPYDFRNNEMMSQLEDLFKKITSFESSLESDVNHIYKKLRSKLKALEHYEEYIRKLNKKALQNLTQLDLGTDIMNECSTAMLFAQQLTHIELDRLKPVGAEELVQYFIMKLASEEARAHPNKSDSKQCEIPEAKTNYLIHDKKLTFCLEAYIQWFNRLTFFITTEIVKHTHRRSRIKLINYFIDAAHECFRLNNFNSMVGILGGLNMQPVRRLKKTWEKIQLDKFQQLEQYMDVSKNFATYRLILKLAMDEARKHDWAMDKIVIPFTSIVLQDVYYIKTHSKDFTSAGGINLKKYYSMATFISEEFVECKQSKCSFERNDEIINYIITSPTFNEDSLMLASFECEPPATLNEKEKYRTLQSTVNKPM